MRFHIVTLGRLRNAGLAAAVREMEHRASRYWPLQVHELELPSIARHGRWPSAVLARLEARLPPASLVICHEVGTSFDSLAFARWLVGLREGSVQDVAFVIGGPYGVPDDLLERAWRRLSMAPWTLSHEVARLVLAEQLYRAGTIVRGEPYHK
ncbi:MAG TPA: 23S rRNA (pseudouridine(1915)-N(3))-methyltransferase RlmH [Gemmatimonadaceae bacterium]|nr:23S rRNA (pseudouridine(1915)-N(3))-methyltransferase RlmH [Gemmatimonadaceae bacterium]